MLGSDAALEQVVAEEAPFCCRIRHNVNVRVHLTLGCLPAEQVFKAVAAAGPPASAIFVDCSTVLPATTTKLAQQAADASVPSFWSITRAAQPRAACAVNCIGAESMQQHVASQCWQHQLHVFGPLWCCVILLWCC